MQPRHLLAWAGGLGPLVLAALLVIVGGTLAFIVLADEVREGGTPPFDKRAIRALRSPKDSARLLGPPWVEEVARDLTALGGVTVLSLVTFAVAGYLLMTRKRHAMWLVLGAAASGLAVNSLLKSLIHRDRPDLVPHLSYVYSSSFPSGHSMLSAVVYLTLGSLLSQFTPGRGAKMYFLAVAILLTFLVGVSRVYMGVHYPTDVLAGWTAGLVWSLVCWLVARSLQRRRLVESDGGGERHDEE